MPSPEPLPNPTRSTVEEGNGATEERSVAAAPVASTTGPARMPSDTHASAAAHRLMLRMCAMLML